MTINAIGFYSRNSILSQWKLSVQCLLDRDYTVDPEACGMYMPLYTPYRHAGPCSRNTKDSHTSKQAGWKRGEGWGLRLGPSCGSIGIGQEAW